MKFVIILTLSLLSLTIEFKGKTLFNLISSMKNAQDPAKKETASFDEWVSVASLEFRNPYAFPPISIAPGKLAKLQTDSSNRLINQLYKPGQKDDSLPPTRVSYYGHLASNFFYLTPAKKDMNVLFTFKIKSVNVFSSHSTPGEFCFDIQTPEDKLFTICMKSNELKFKCICQIVKEIGQNPPVECLGDKKVPDVKIPETVIDVNEYEPIILIPQPSRFCNEDWNYDNKGANWECICSEGKEQSPIDLPLESVVESDIAPLFTFNEIKVEEVILSKDGQLMDKQYMYFEYRENSLKVLSSNFGKITTVNGAMYEAQEIAFHMPAEHKIAGQTFNMEMEITYFGKTVGDIDKQVVLSFLFKKKPGVYNAFIQDLIEYGLPSKQNKRAVIGKNLYIPKIQYTTDYEGEYKLKPFSFYTYQGSISHPPCTERTIRYVVSEPIPISGITLSQFEEALRRPTEMDNIGNFENARTVQPLNERTVFFWDHTKYCDIQSEKLIQEKKEDGHFEKVMRQQTQYYYVGGPSPTGLPGAFLVDEKEAKGL